MEDQCLTPPQPKVHLAVPSDTNPVIPVTKPFLPPRADLDRYISEIYATSLLSNFGPLSLRLEEILGQDLGAPSLCLLGNGTLALQLLFRVFNLRGKVITTPYSFVASSNALLWEGLEPVFCDIDDSLNMDCEHLVRLLSEHEVSAVLSVSIYGRTEGLGRTAAVAAAAGVPHLVDAAHAFAAGMFPRLHCQGAAMSFHATKLFQTGEGGAILLEDATLALKARSLANFGLDARKNPTGPGINAKMSELHAAMGLAVYDHISEIRETRRHLSDCYRARLGDFLESIDSPNDSYFPVLLTSEADRDRAYAALLKAGIGARKYFWPALHRLGAVVTYPCPRADEIAARVLCLPLYSSLTEDEVVHICTVLRSSLGHKQEKGPA